MPIIPVGYADCRLVFSIVGVARRMSVSFGLLLNDDTDLDGIANDVNDVFVSRLVPIMSETVTMEAISITTISRATEVAYGSTGTVTAFDLNCYEAALVKKITGLRGRKNRGRNYWPGFLSETNIEPNGTIPSTTANALTTAFQEFLQDVQGIATVDDMVILHQTGLLTDVPPPVAEMVCSQQVGIQRRRRDKVVV